MSKIIHQIDFNVNEKNSKLEKNFLSNYDEKIGNRWDKVKSDNLRFKEICPVNNKKKNRINDCVDHLFLRYDNQLKKFKVIGMNRCKVRYCPVCEFVEIKKMRAILDNAIIKLIQDQPKLEFIQLTLTIKNPKIIMLEDNLEAMSKAFHRLQLLKRNKQIVGFFRTLELTKPKNESDAVHPHYHVVLAVKPKYFSGEFYWSKEKWISEWKRVMKLDYDPSVYIQKIKSDNPEELWKAVMETIKYQIKTDDIFFDNDWFKILFKQMVGKRRYASGGLIKEYLAKVKEPKEIDISDDEQTEILNKQLHFNFNRGINKYCKS
jgi:plasmid rolling circle replication initiator protein Rep